ncbi:3-isopropylmalate dehydratase [candidate division BRC1 bacterium SM23_51]|nr:MAG: 3-isopropylmalate dehydratase [candidate division BRC1 bacterium SM23_51]
MKRRIRGLAFVLGDNVDTDQIIPADKLVYDPSVEAERHLFGKFALSGVPEARSGLPRGGIHFVPEGGDRSPYCVVVAGKNFGCGSSREHAPLALAEAGVEAVVAVSYARIFFRNAVNGGYLVPCESLEDLSRLIATGDEVEINIESNTLRLIGHDVTYTLKPLGDILPILEAGDLFAYARQGGILDR